MDFFFFHVDVHGMFYRIIKLLSVYQILCQTDVLIRYSRAFVQHPPHEACISGR